ncbi:MAG TPA: hypothetical protein VF167_03590 [Longimicrobiaceae bacterium]
MEHVWAFLDPIAVPLIFALLAAIIGWSWGYQVGRIDQRAADKERERWEHQEGISDIERARMARGGASWPRG